MSLRALPARPPRPRLLLVLLAIGVSAGAGPSRPDVVPNYQKAAQFDASRLRPFVYDAGIQPNWIGKTDTFWYSFRTAEGTTYHKVNPRLGTKEPLLDRDRLATLLTEAVQKPYDPATLPLERPSLDDDGIRFRFVVEGDRYEFGLANESLVKLGKAPAPPGGPGRPGGGRGTRRDGDRDNQNDDSRRDGQQQDDQGQIQRGDTNANSSEAPDDAGRRGPSDRSYSPDRKSYVFARGYNLFFAEVDANKARQEEKAKADEKVQFEEKAKAEEKKPFGPEPQDAAKADDEKAEEEPREVPKADAKPAKKDPDADDRVTQLTTDGVDKFSFGGGDNDDKARPSRVIWSPDSKSFCVLRRDSRAVKELFLVNSLATPRPTLERYPYGMPGEEGIRANELHVYSPGKKALIKVAPRWDEESSSDLHWGKDLHELRFARVDRLVRHVEFCSLDAETGAARALIAEGFENAPLTVQPARELPESDEMIWWSERSGWGHFYLYTRDGKLKNPITSGGYRAGRIVALDAKNRRLFFSGNAREKGENPNYDHLYSVQLDGTGLTLLDPGNSNHRSILSPSREFLVDNASRIDQTPTVVLRKPDGTAVMELEKADVSQLEGAGWKAPETFVVKAADGVTDLYGNLWKPFDFDPHRRYPIIVHVYPGPQQEGTVHTFTPLAGEQALAQIGFVVIQVGHRGGTPKRSKAYASYGYFNLRDYALADKKAAIEQLALRHPFVDINRVGIYGHSGGGFMTAAALLQKPYNTFFKVGVSSSGNHDNNIYGSSWAERYHGLRVEEVIAKEGTQAAAGKESAESAPPQDGTGTAAKKAKEIVNDVVKGVAKATKFTISVPTNAELAANLEGRLLLVHGDMDNNVHPAGTMRLVDALIKANKRFDMLILPGKRHGYADFQPYFTQRMWEYFAEHLLGDTQPGADLLDKATQASPN